MTQLSYNIALDVYHTIFRLLFLNEKILDQKVVHSDRLRILDFYVAFPYQIASFSFKSEHVHFRKIAKQFDRLRPYGQEPENWILFSRMEVIQKGAFETILRGGFLDEVQYSKGFISFKFGKLPSDIIEKIAAWESIVSPLLPVFGALMQEYELLGNDGLKRRSKLLEHKYDVV